MNSVFPRVATAILVVTVIVSVTDSAAAIPAVPPWHASSPWTTETATVQVGDSEVIAEIADTRPLQIRGLGYRDGLESGTGMIFVFDSPSVRTFWMKGMRFCIDIVWIAQSQVVGFEDSVCPSPGIEDVDLPRFSSEVPVDYVLEVPEGWMNERDYGPGTPVEITFPQDENS